MEHFADWELLNTDTKLTRSILKYGSEPWVWDIIEECNDDLLTSREIHWISYYNSYYMGYNSTLGGDGNKRYEFDKADIVNKYNNGISARKIASEYGCHYHYIHEILRDAGVDVSCKMGKPKPVACFDRYKMLIDTFNTKKEIQDYLIQYGYGNSLGNVAHTISQACETGQLRYKRYWMLLTDDNIEHIKRLPKCGISEYSGERSILIKKEVVNNRCKTCGKLVGAYSTSKLCKSCSQVIAKGKSPKPSKEELIKLLESGLQVKQIATIYDRSGSTVSTWIKSYGIR